MRIVKRGLLALVVSASAMTGAALAAPPVTEAFNTNPVLSATQAPGVWYTDRYAPAGFQSAVFGGGNRLMHSISAADCDGCRGGFNGAFYNTQGRKYDVPSDTKVMSIEMYVPSSWATSGKRMAGFWGTAFDSGNAISGYPIIEFTDSPDGSGLPRFRGWDNGTWIDMGLPTGFAYDTWQTLTIQLTNGNFRYTVGDLVLTVPGLGSAYIGNTILQGHNTTGGVTYDIYWDNFSYAGSNAALALTPTSTCVNTNTLVVHVDLSQAPQAVVGGQFFVQYDNTTLRLDGISVGSAPFTSELYRNFSGNPMAPNLTLPSTTGLIDFAVGVPGGGPGTPADTTMAVLTFHVLHDTCATAGDLVTFRTHNPVSRVTNALGDPLTTALTDAASIRLDATAPTIVCPPNVTVNADAGLCTAAQTSLMGAGWTLYGDANFASKAGRPGVTLDMPSRNSDPSGYSAASYVMPTPVPFNAMTTLGTDYKALQGTIYGGSPRFSLRIDYDNDGMFSAGDKSLWVYLGTPPGFNDAVPLGQWFSTGNLLGGPVTRFDLQSWGGPWVGDYATAASIVGARKVLSVSIAVDAGWALDQDFQFDNISINGSVTTLGGSASDNCTPTLSITGVRSDSLPLDDPYPLGDTFITWTATDDCGNSSAPCVQTVHVNAFNTMSATVRLENVSAGPFTRCITFGLPTGGCTTYVDQVMTFTNGIGTATFSIPCGNYSCLTARDKRHTLRRTADNGPIDHFYISGTQYVARFIDDTGSGGSDDRLLGGNLNDDPYVDILDFGVFVGQFSMNVGANTTCSTPFPHADISGDGLVTGPDLTYIQAHFIQFNELDCCGAFVQAPRSRIGVDELLESGEIGMIASDLNHDSVVDVLDVGVFVARGGLPCRADWDGNGAFQPADIAMFVNSWLAGLHNGNPAPDFDGNGRTEPADLAAFVNAWLNALSNGC